MKMKKMTMVLGMLVMLTACGNIQNATTADEQPPPETPAESPAPAEESPPYTETLASDAAIPRGNTAAVFNTDWIIGNLSSLLLSNPGSPTLARITTDGSDAVVRSFGGRIYVVNRGGTGTVQVIDPATFGVIANYSVGNGSNPYDIVAVSDEKAYVLRYEPENDAENRDDVLVVNPLTGERLGSIDLKPYTADDGERLARAAQMVLVDGRIYACMQDLPANLMNPADTNGKVAIIDTETDAVVAVVQLAGMNPSDITYSPLTEKFYVASTGRRVNFVVDVSDATGGIEVFRREGDGYVSEGIVIDDASFGADVTEVRLASAERGYTIVGSSKVASFNPTTYALVNAGVYQSPAFFLPDISVDGEGRLLVAEQDFNAPGIVFVNADGTVASGPVGVGAPPVSITFVDVR